MLSHSPRMLPSLLFLTLVSVTPFVVPAYCEAAEPSGVTLSKNADLFRKENLAAWCIVPFDKAKRNPEQRAEMLERLGIKKFVYDYRAEHEAQFGEELVALKKHGVELSGWMFPAGPDATDPAKLNAKGMGMLELFDRHGVKPQLWVIKGGQSIDPGSPEEQERRVLAEVTALRTTVAAAKSRGLQVGLYNHGGWFGEPENEIAIIERLRKEGFENVGIVYNQHHGHGHIAKFPELLKRMLPYLICINLNGNDIEGDKKGRKILPIGAGSEDPTLLRSIRESGYHGLIGILNHTNEDAEERLLDNLEGLAWVTKQLNGQAAGPKVEYRSWKPVP